MDSFGPGGPSNGSRGFRMEAIRRLNARLDRTSIEHLDWKRCIELYDRPDTFFFCDPPYTECNAGMYAAWTNTDVQLLRDTLAKLRGKWLVTLNDTADIRAIFAGCKITGFSRPRGISNKPGEPAKAYKEMVITPAA